MVSSGFGSVRAQGAARDRRTLQSSRDSAPWARGALPRGLRSIAVLALARTDECLRWQGRTGACSFRCMVVHFSWAGSVRHGSGPLLK